MSTKAKSAVKLVVGIGASAGGLTALKELLPHLPVGSGVAYIALLHMDPTHPSQVDQILSNVSSLNVCAAKNGIAIQADSFYVIPSDKSCTIQDEKLKLEQISHVVGPRHSIDRLFYSLAENYTKRCIGIILSGTGSDGLRGCQAIKANEGIVLAQKLSTAQYSGMPNSVIRAQLADIELPVEKMGSEIEHILEWPGKNKQKAIAPQSQNIFDTLLETLTKKTGIPFDQYKESTIRRRIERRMVVNRITALEEYTKLIKTSKNEVHALFKDIQISVTEFFRDESIFEDLKNAIKTIVEQKKDGEAIRIWVAGCATGEEVYSIAMLLANEIHNRMNNSPIQIFGTDIDEDAITIARKAIYIKDASKYIPPEFLNKYIEFFDGTFQINKEIRDMVVFAIHDLLRDPPFSKMDIISCRNVLIYFKHSAQVRLLANFHYSLNPSGYLVLGASEGSGKANELFEANDKSTNIYSRKNVKDITPTFAYQAHVPQIESRKQQNLKYESIDQQVRDLIFEQLAPECVVVDERLNIVHVHGDVTKFIKLPEGVITVNIIDMVIPPLRLEVRLALQKSQREQQRIDSIEVIYTDQLGKRLVSVAAVPMRLSQEITKQTLLLFNDRPAVPSDLKIKAKSDDDANFRIQELDQELAATRDHLHTNIEELEAANEELQSINEEFQSTTEELQSSNEEFQTTNEELQSTNEELSTVNDELRYKTENLEEAKKDLEGILNEIASGIVLLDHELRVTHYSASSMQIFNLLPSSIGKPLISVGESNLIDLALLSSDIHKAIQQNIIVERELKLGEQYFLVRLIPQITSNKEFQGLIISFIEQTERIERLYEANRLATIVQDSNDAITLLSLEGKILAWNKGAKNTYGYSSEEALTMNITKIIPEDLQQETIDMLKRSCTEVNVTPFQTKRVTKSGQEIDVLLTITALHAEHDQPYAIATTERDITDIINMEIKHKQRQMEIEHLARFNSIAMMAATLAHELNQPLSAIENYCDAAISIIKDDSSVNKDLIQILKDTNEQGKRASNIINNIREYVSRREISKTEVDVNQLIKDVKYLTKFDCSDSKIKVKLDLSKRPILVHADKIQIQHALLNLLKNSIDSLNHAGSIERIIFISSQLDKNMAQICIEDTGPGLSSEISQLLFKPFETKKIEGLGLGLLISRFIAEEHGGQLWFDPDVSTGAKFYFSLPLTET